MRCIPKSHLAFSALFALVLSFSTAGTARAQAWTVRYNGAGNGNDVATALTVDASGNTFVTGRAVGVGQNPGTTDIITSKYSPTGAVLWTALFDGLSKHNDGGEAIAVDAAGNVYVAGYATGVGSGTDLLTVKYNSAGVEQWFRRKAAPGGGNDKLWAIAVDAAGSVHVTGAYTFSAAADTDVYTIKYDTSGTELWNARINSGTADAGFGIALDGSGNVHVTGRTGTPGGTLNYRTVKYSAAGVQQWIMAYNGPAGTDDEAYAIALDGSGNVLVTGYSNGVGTGSDYATVKYSAAAGTQLWATRYNGPAGLSDEARAIGVDASGKIYVSGASMDTASTSGFATIRYGTNGSPAWTHREDSGLGMDGARRLSIHSGGDVYVSGGFTTAGQGSNRAFFRYDYTGHEMHSATYNGSGNAGDVGTGIGVNDSNKAISITGPSVGAGTEDYATSKYNHITLATDLVTDVTAGAATQTRNLSATLTRNADAFGLPGRTVSFQVSGVNVGSAVTDAQGKATLPFLIPGGTPLGTYVITTSFAGDVDYNATSDTGDLFVRKMAVITVYDRQGTITFPVSLRALLKVDNLVYPGATLRFFVDGVEVGSGVTGTNGVATYSHTITEAVGNHVITAEFDGDTNAASAVSLNGNLLVKIIKTSISVNSPNLPPGYRTVLKGTLTGGGGPLAGRPVTFKMDGVFMGNRVTDAAGYAEVEYVIVAPLGAHAITVEFAGDAGLYDACVGTGTLTVRANTRVTADKVSAPAGTAVNYGAVLKRSDTGDLLEGRTLNFYDTATSALLGTAVTDINGRAEISINAPAAGVKQLIQVRFAGEATYRDSYGNGYLKGT